MPGLLTHISRYSLANILTTLAGLISFPILTRLLGVSGYGLLSIVNATVLLMVGFGKCGLQHASLRFYSEMQASADAQDRRRFYSTVLFGMGGLGIGVTVIWALVSQLVPGGFWADPSLPLIFLISAPLILFQILHSAGTSILQARQASGVLSTYSVIHRYAHLGFVVGALLAIGATLEVYYSASVLAEALALSVMLALVLRGVSLTPRAFSPSLLRRLLAYAIPMIGYELSGVFLNVGDRYVIQYYLGAGPLGAYSAAYNLCIYIKGTLIAAAAAAVLPAYLRIWEAEGERATVSFIHGAVANYVLLAVPMAAGFSVVGGELIGLLATEDFLDGARAVPYIISGQLIAGLLIFVGAGLFVRKRAPVLTAVAVASAAFNLALNLLLVPRYGIMGAALATLLSYVLLIVLAFWAGRRALRLTLPWRRGLNSLAGALVMVWVIAPVHAEAAWLKLGLQVALGIVVYFALLIVLDRPLRRQLRGFVTRL